MIRQIVYGTIAVACFVAGVGIPLVRIGDYNDQYRAAQRENAQLETQRVVLMIKSTHQQQVLSDIIKMDRETRERDARGVADFDRLISSHEKYFQGILSPQRR